MHQLLRTTCDALLGFAVLLILATPLVAQPSESRAKPSARPKPIFVEIPSRQEIPVSPTASENEVPERFRVRSTAFTAETTLSRTVGAVRTHDVTFPSSFHSGSKRNDVVPSRYFQPSGPGPHPACVLLHELGGEFRLIHMVADMLARRGVATLVIKMPYYGERQDPGSARRMISFDPVRTVAGVTQAVHDSRRAVAWLAARREVDPERIGITGISLGGFVAAIASSAEPRSARTAIVLAGGDVAGLIWEHWDPAAETFRKQWQANGGTRETLVRALAEVEPTAHAKRLLDRPILMVAATKDEIVPRKSTLALYEATERKPEMLWLDAGHVSAVLHLLRIVDRLAKFHNAK